MSWRQGSVANRNVNIFHYIYVLLFVGRKGTSANGYGTIEIFCRTFAALWVDVVWFFCYSLIINVIYCGIASY